jgi:acetyl esterase/lipase
MLRTSFVLVTLLALCNTNAVSAQPRVDKNVVFGTYSGLALLMDVHHPARKNGRGVVVINGSGWQRPLGYDAPLLKDDEADRSVETLVQPALDAGYTAFVLTHRAAPRFTYPAAVLDVQRGVRYVRHHAADYGIAPDKLGAIGFSSGGYLALMLGLQDAPGNPGDADPVNREPARVQAVVAIDAPADLRALSLAGALFAFQFIGAFAIDVATAQPFPAGTAEEKLFREASPISYVSADDAPVLLIHGSADDLIPVAQAEVLAKSLRAAAVEERLEVVPNGQHVVWSTPGVNWDAFPSMISQWLDAHLQ